MIDSVHNVKIGCALCAMRNNSRLMYTMVQKVVDLFSDMIASISKYTYTHTERSRIGIKEQNKRKTKKKSEPKTTNDFGYIAEAFNSWAKN